MGFQSYTTRTLPDTLNPKWNFNCQFFIKDIYQDVLCITVFDRDQFSPDGMCNTFVTIIIILCPMLELETGGVYAGTLWSPASSDCLFQERPKIYTGKSGLSGLNQTSSSMKIHAAFCNRQNSLFPYQEICHLGSQKGKSKQIL